MINTTKNDTQSLEKISPADETETSSRKILTQEYLTEASSQNQIKKTTDQRPPLSTLDFSPNDAKKAVPESLLTKPAESRNLLLIGEINSNGQKIREIFIDKTTGHNREFVIARNSGTEHRIEDKRITKIPFDSDQDMQSWRLKQIEDRASKIIEQYGKTSDDDTASNSTVNLQKFGETLNQISHMEDLTEQEKVFLWDNIMSRQEDDYTLDARNTEANETGKPQSFDLNLALLKNGFHDFYHIQLANLPPEAASRRVFIQEMSKGSDLTASLDQNTENFEDSNGKTPTVKTNEQIAANIAASESQVAALRQFKINGFAGYAKEWNQRFVSTEKLQLLD